ncbi:MAG: STAS domain-containing protein [Nitrospirota bacterium]
MEKSLVMRDAFTIREISETMHQLQGALRESDAVVVDASRVRRVDIAALQMLVAAQKECRETRKRLTIVSSAEIAALQASIGMEL